MYVCLCNAVTDSDIRNAVEDGARSLKQLRKMTNCGSTCGCCNDMATNILNEALAQKRENSEFLPVMQPA